jgi:hypothetical protein
MINKSSILNLFLTAELAEKAQRNKGFDHQPFL